MGSNRSSAPGLACFMDRILPDQPLQWLDIRGWGYPSGLGGTCRTQSQHQTNHPRVSTASESLRAAIADLVGPVRPAPDNDSPFSDHPLLDEAPADVKGRGLQNLLLPSRRHP